MEKGGRKTTSGLFKEDGNDKAPYSLEKFKAIFLEKKESSGYLCAQEALFLVEQRYRWEEWKRIFEGNSRLQRIHEAWQEELEISVRADAENQLALGCDPKDFARLRYVFDGKLQSKRKVGRPTKGELTKKERIKKGIEDKRRENPGDLNGVLELANKDKK